jgi:L-asparaginase
VTQGQYQTSKRMNELGVVSGADITTEAAITKLMVVLGQEHNPARVRTRLEQSISGEMSS